MVVLLFHPTEELKITRLQKNLIFNLNDENTTWYRHLPLWAEIPENELKKIDSLKEHSPTTKCELKEILKGFEGMEVGELELSQQKNQIILPIILKQKNGSKLHTTLPLLHLFNSNEQITAEKQEFIKKLLQNSSFSINNFVVFRLGIAQLHNTFTTVQSSQTSFYILQDSVWFKKSK